MSATSILFDAPGPRARARHRVLTGFGILLAAGTIGGILWKLGEAGQLRASLWTALFTSDAWFEYIVPGILKTLQAAAVSIVLAIVFGLVFGMGRLSSIAPVRWVCGVVVEFFRAVPVLLMMYFAFRLYTVNNVFGVSFNSFYAVVTGLTLYNGSVIAELVRSGVHQLPKGQSEAGLSVGLTPTQTLRSIQLPQALTAMLPALVGQLVVILKDTALGTAITYPELLQQTRDLGTAYGNVIPAYILAAVLFILINYGLTVLAGRVEKRINRRGKTAGGAATAAVMPAAPGTEAGADAAPGAAPR
ncbi:amino acid ABC transporter permease [Oryzobacter terrae]|uniref:amino acid ABC transporter permease n=1 Tax=Oryzobacter terrae TaxID=1620385 RepID=UPI00366E88CE